jgi:ParB family chromosome partitioning protein
MSKKLSSLVAAKASEKKEEKLLTKVNSRVAIPAVDAAQGADSAIQKVQKYKEIDPKRCRPWTHHNRPKVWLTPETCAGLIESIKGEGQQELGLVRQVHDEDGVDYEVIYGVRRWYATSQIPGAKFKARISDDDDRQCAILMHFENEESADISGFEKALSYKELIQSKVFENQADLAKALRVSRPYIHKMISAAALFDEDVIKCLLAPFTKELSIKKVQVLNEQLLTPASRKSVLKAAEALLEQGETKLDKILSTLATCGKSVNDKTMTKKTCHYKKGRKGLLFSERQSNGRIVVTIEPGFQADAGDASKKLIADLIAERLRED